MNQDDLKSRIYDSLRDPLRSASIDNSNTITFTNVSVGSDSANNKENNICASIAPNVTFPQNYYDGSFAVVTYENVSGNHLCYGLDQEYKVHDFCFMPAIEEIDGGKAKMLISPIFLEGEVNPSKYSELKEVIEANFCETHDKHI